MNTAMNATRRTLIARSAAASVSRPAMRVAALSTIAPSHHTEASPKATYAAAAAAAAAAAVAVVAYSAEDSKVHAAAPAVDFKAVQKDLVAMMEAEDASREDGTSIGGTLVRLAWHASGTYCKADGTGGSNGACMRMSPEKDWGANAGLGVGRKFVGELKAVYPEASYADLWTLAGATAISYMGGPEIAWYPGRTDSDKPTTVPDGRLPDADKGTIGGTIQHIRDIFGRMGFSDREMVALIGAHAVGRCHTEASGYWGPWSNAESTFSNEYFRLLVEEKWTIKTTHNGNKWTGPEQFEDPSGQLMMLPSDMALVWDKDFRKVVEEYTADEELFFKDFSSAFAKLISLGTPCQEAGGGDGIVDLIKSFLAKLGF
ncbi:unnamed protein product [Pylaiella littoralis]